MKTPRVNLFGHYTRCRWGETVGKISLHTGELCPNRALGSCIYCCSGGFLPHHLNPGDPIEVQLAKGKDHMRRTHGKLFFGCFQHETPGAVDAEGLISKIDCVLKDPQCVGLSLSTRPDHVESTWLKRVVDAGLNHPEKPIIIEVGLQSAQARSLEFLNRNHTVEAFVEAAENIRAEPHLQLGAHLILGIPGEQLEDMRGSVQLVCRTGIRHLKLHHLQVVKGTRLYELYQHEPFFLPGVDEYLGWLIQLLPWIPADVLVHRLWGNCHIGLLHQPRWNLESNQVFERLFKLLEETNVIQGERVGADGSPI